MVDVKEIIERDEGPRGRRTNLRQMCGQSVRRHSAGKEFRKAPGVTAQRLFIAITKSDKGVRLG